MAQNSISNITLIQSRSTISSLTFCIYGSGCILTGGVGKLQVRVTAPWLWGAGDLDPTHSVFTVGEVWQVCFSQRVNGQRTGQVVRRSIVTLLLDVTSCWPEAMLARWYQNASIIACYGKGTYHRWLLGCSGKGSLGCPRSPLAVDMSHEGLIRTGKVVLENESSQKHCQFFA